MQSADICRFEVALLAFVERAAKSGAAAEEVEVLPAVAQVLAQLIS